MKPIVILEGVSTNTLEERSAELYNQGYKLFRSHIKAIDDSTRWDTFITLIFVLPDAIIRKGE